MKTDQMIGSATLAGTLSDLLALELPEGVRVVSVQAVQERTEPAFTKAKHLHEPQGAGEITEAVTRKDLAETFDPLETTGAETSVDEEEDAAAVFGGGNALPDRADEAATSAEANEVEEATAPPGVELDSDGVPWDGRIHASSKTKLKKTQQWKTKRGIDPALVDSVTIELKEAMALAPPPAADEPTTEAAAPPPPAEKTEAAAPPPPPPPVNTEAATIATFAELMHAVAAEKAAGRLDDATISVALESIGLQSFPLLGARPDLIPSLVKELGL